MSIGSLIGPETQELRKEVNFILQRYRAVARTLFVSSDSSAFARFAKLFQTAEGFVTRVPM